MSNKADSNYIKVVFSEEGSLGETPSSPVMQEMRINGEKIKFTPKYTKSKEIRSDRQTVDLVMTGAEINGEVPFELSFGDYDKWFEHAFFNNFTTAKEVEDTDLEAVADDGGSGDSAITSSTTDLSTFPAGMWVKISGFTTDSNNTILQVKSSSATKLTFYGAKLSDEAAGDTVKIYNSGMLQNGTLKKSFLVEKQYTDIDKYQYFNGIMVDGMSLDFAAEKVIEGKFKVIGMKGSEMVDTSVAGSVLPASTNEKMNSVSDLTNLEKDDVAIPTDLMTLSVEVNNALRGQKAIATLGFCGLGVGGCEVKGKIETYLDSDSIAAFYNAGLQNSPFKLSFVLQDSSERTYVITIYRAKLDSLSNNADSGNKDVMINSSYEAIIGQTIEKTIQIDRFE